jgi:hypothetical protein
MKNLLLSVSAVVFACLGTQAQNPLTSTNKFAVYSRNSITIYGGTAIHGPVLTAGNLDNRVANFSIGSCKASNYTANTDALPVQALVLGSLNGTQKINLLNNGYLKVQNQSTLTCAQSGSITTVSKGATVLAEGNVSQNCSSIFSSSNIGNIDVSDKYAYVFNQKQACFVNTATNSGYHYDFTSSTGNQVVDAGVRPVTFVKVSAASMATGNLQIQGINESNSNIIVINVDGNNNTIDWNSSSFQINSTSTAHTVINFYNTTTVNLNNSLAINATVFAPNADVTLTSASMGVDGQIVTSLFNMHGGYVGCNDFTGNFACNLYSIGDNVFEDKNADGTYDWNASDIGVNDITVRLLNASGNIIQTTITKYYGTYYFFGISPGTYAVEIVVPSLFQATPANRVTEIYVDSKNDGVIVSGNTFRTSNFNLTAGNGSDLRWNMDLGITRNTDGDALVDYVDTDDDNDGISDTEEDKGCGNMQFPPWDGDEDNDQVPNWCDNITPSFTWLDKDNNSLHDYYDRDGDMIPNGRDLDSDGDGILDAVETAADTDRDGVPNFFDADSDNDGITDVREATLANNDIDNDGMLDGFEVDYDGVRGIADPGQIEGNPWGAAGLTPVNSDGTVGSGTALGSDNIPDYLDIDSDNDAITDNIEAQPGCSYIVPVCGDTNCDGLFNLYDNNGNSLRQGMSFTIQNIDNDALPDYRDPDSDGDGSFDFVEATRITISGYVASPSTGTITDADGDGLIDAYDILNRTTANSADACKNATNTYFNTNGSTTPVADAGSDTPLGGTGCTRGWRNPTVLPVTLTSFYADVLNNQANITWTVSNENNLSVYSIEKSADGIQFANLNNVAATGKSKYNTSDDLTTAITYYRLRSISKDGSTQISQTITVRKNGLVKGELSIAPNPAVNYFTLSLKNNEDGVATIRIIDVNGKVALTEKRQVKAGAATLNFENISTLANGIYLVEVANGTQITSTKLLIHK